MDIKKELIIKWAPNEDSRYDYEQKMFVQGDKIVPTLSISILNGNVDRMFLIAHFYMPDGVTNVYTDSKTPINGERFEIPIPESALLQKGEHEILIGLKSNSNGSTIYGPRIIRYEVLENKQLGNECMITPQKALFGLDLLEGLSEKIAEIKGLTISSTELYTSSKILSNAQGHNIGVAPIQKNIDVDTNIGIENYSPWKKISLSFNTKEKGDISKKYTAYKIVHIYALLSAKDYIITERGEHSLNENSKFLISFWLSSKTNTIHYKVDWGSEVLADEVNLMLI